MGCAFNAGGGWSDLLIGDWADIETAGSMSDIRVRHTSFEMHILRNLGRQQITIFLHANESLKQDTATSGSSRHHGHCSDAEGDLNVHEKDEDKLDAEHPAESHNIHAPKNCWTMCVDYIYRHNDVPRDSFDVTSGDFCNALKYIDIQRQTQTDLENIEEHIPKQVQKSLSQTIGKVAPVSKSSELVFRLLEKILKKNFSGRKCLQVVNIQDHIATKGYASSFRYDTNFNEHSF